MDQSLIFTPVFAMMLLTICVWVFMYSKRIPFIQKLGIEPNNLTPEKLNELSPASVSNPSDNLKNLFEVPVLFYALTIILFATQSVDGFYIALAWLFVLFRVCHSITHCTINAAMTRFYFYALSCLCLFTMVFRAAILHVIGLFA